MLVDLIRDFNLSGDSIDDNGLDEPNEIFYIFFFDFFSVQVRVGRPVTFISKLLRWLVKDAILILISNNKQ